MNRILKYTLMTFMTLMMTCVVSMSTANGQIGPIIKVGKKFGGAVVKKVDNVFRPRSSPIIINNDSKTTVNQPPRPRARGRVWGDLRGH